MIGASKHLLLPVSQEKGIKRWLRSSQGSKLLNSIACRTERERGLVELIQPWPVRFFLLFSGMLLSQGANLAGVTQHNVSDLSDLSNLHPAPSAELYKCYGRVRPEERTKVRPGRYEQPVSFQVSSTPFPRSILSQGLCRRPWTSIGCAVHTKCEIG